MKNGRINSRDVAKIAGVSTSTVSLVVRGSPLVNAATRARVQEVIDQMGYQSHAAAAALRSSRANILGYIVPEIIEAVNDVFRHQILSAVITRTSEENYHVLVDTFLNTPHHTSLFNSGRIDGALVDWEFDDAMLEELHRRGVPFVLVGRDVRTIPINWVKVDERGGAYEVTRHLIKLGHTRIALIAGNYPASKGAEPIKGGKEASLQRSSGFQRAMNEARLPIDPRYMVEGDWRYASGLILGKRLLELHPRPTAIFALSEVMAVGVLNAAHQLGLRIPEDLSVVTTEDSPWVEYVRPQLTAIHLPIYEVGIRAAEVLMERIENPSMPPQQIVLPATLVVRESSAPPGTLD